MLVRRSHESGSRGSEGPLRIAEGRRQSAGLRRSVQNISGEKFKQIMIRLLLRM